MPKTNDGFPVWLFKYLDDLEGLDKYAWGIVEYKGVIGGLSRASQCLHEGKNSLELYVTGCVALMQVTLTTCLR